MVAPDHVNAEVLNALRGLVRWGQVTLSRADQVADDLRAAPLVRVATTPLIAGMWRWRDNASSYDAGYVALAEAFDCPLITADHRLMRVIADTVSVVAV